MLSVALSAARNHVVHDWKAGRSLRAEEGGIDHWLLIVECRQRGKAAGRTQQCAAAGCDVVGDRGLETNSTTAPAA